MSTGGTVEELDAQVDALVGAVVLHRAVITDAEEHTVAYPTVESWRDIAAVHREIVAEYVEEIRLLRAEIALLPRQRGPVD
jgi:uncharacterized membrane protein